MSTEISLNCFQYCLFRTQMLSGFFLDFWIEKVVFEGDVTTAKPSLINQERAIWHLFLYLLQWTLNVSEESWPVEMHVLSLSPHVSSHSFSAVASSTNSIKHHAGPQPVFQLVWMGSELWTVPNRMWLPSLQYTWAICSDHGNAKGPAQRWLSFASSGLGGEHPVSSPQWYGSTFLSRRSWRWIDNLVKYRHKTRARQLTGTACGEWRAAHCKGQQSPASGIRPGMEDAPSCVLKEQDRASHISSPWLCLGSLQYHSRFVQTLLILLLSSAVFRLPVWLLWKLWGVSASKSVNLLWKWE